ncbi:glycosyltransferase [Sanguibacter suarezii]|uniref:glycosyltransferase n=1 Tax=Sanguibacter suarezii TaxID=60921 RepID=UPI0014708370|nr:glycosyltransferase [Sanguibacter suarezii]
MSAAYDHFILTRFNLRYGADPAPESWLRHRLGYFERVCLPSVSSQSGDFRWLILLDEEREDWFDDEISRLSKVGCGFEPIWISGMPTAADLVAPATARSEAVHILTTRLDNDDAIADGFVVRVQGQFTGQDREFINFTNGLQMADDGRLFHRSDPSNAFMTLIERREDAVGVYVDWHDRLATHGPVTQVAVEPMWLQAVHDRNIANTVQGIRARPGLLAERFTVTVNAALVGRLELLRSQVTSIWRLGVRIVQKPSRMVWAAKVVGARVNNVLRGAAHGR